jgi:hypothetical protein
MPDLLKYLPQIITESAKSPLGIVALMVCALAALAVYFFRAASEKTRVIIFVILLIGVAWFSSIVIHTVSVSGPDALRTLIERGHEARRGDVPTCKRYLQDAAIYLKVRGNPQWKRVDVDSAQWDPNLLGDAVNRTVAVLEQSALK